MGELVRMTDDPRARWAVVDKSRKLFLSRRQTRDEAEHFFASNIIGRFDDAWLIQEGDVEDYHDNPHTKMGSL